MTLTQSQENEIVEMLLSGIDLAKVVEWVHTHTYAALAEQTSVVNHIRARLFGS